jgi:hypothetical protein
MFGFVGDYEDGRTSANKPGRECTYCITCLYKCITEEKWMMDCFTVTYTVSLYYVSRIPQTVVSSLRSRAREEKLAVELVVKELCLVHLPGLADVLVYLGSLATLCQ